MNRIFGKKKEAPPPPSMTEAAGRVDGRVGTLDAKVNGLITCFCEGGSKIDNDLFVSKKQSSFLSQKYNCVLLR